MNQYNKVVEIKLEDLVPFSLQTAQTYQGERLEQLMDSIERQGLMNPIIVRPVDGGKYEILCGHNRVKAMKELKRQVISAYVRDGLSDDEAMELFYDSNLNQQSFSDWSYSQKIDAVKYLEQQIKKNSQQGKRTDLDEKRQNEGEGTSVYTRQKSKGSVRREEIREKMARRLGISAATFSKFRRIIKLPDDLLESIVKLLDQKRISFEAAYQMSALEKSILEMFIHIIDVNSDKKVDMDKLKEFCRKQKKREFWDPIPTKDELKAILVSKEEYLIKPDYNTRYGNRDFN